VIKSRLASLLAAETLADMSNVPGRCHALTADRAGQFAVHLLEPYRLVFVPVVHQSASGPDGALDLKRVTAISILEIVNYHDN
jgi:toxin HigB-1